MFGHILCPVDFSESSSRALDYGLALARRHGARLIVLHVLPEVLADPDAYPYLSEPVLPSGQTRERALHQLGELVHRARSKKLAVDVVLADGDVVDEIVKRSEGHSRLVVMGTHGRRGFRRLLLGSVTERVLRRSSAPVLSVPPSAGDPSGDGVFRRILCPIEFSPASLAGLELALGLAGDDGRVTVAHVVQFYFDASLGEAVAFDMEEVRQRHREDAEAKLERAVPAERREGGRVRLETVGMQSDGPYREILRLAERDDADLIVMGVLGRSSTDLFFFGSTANHVVRQAGCPVLTVRPPAPAHGEEPAA